MTIFCHQCGKKIDSDARFCESCGATIKSNVSKSNESEHELKTPVVSMSSGSLIKCGSCHYEGQGEPARSIAGIILACLCIFIAWPITLIYFLVTYKHQCPKCKSTFVSVKNIAGEFIPQSKSTSRTILKIIGWGLFGIALLIIVSMVLLYFPVWK